MQDAWRAYLELAAGLTEASRRKAEQVARDLLGRTGATAAQLQGFAEELVSTSRANREGLTKLVRYEVDRALGAVGLATADEVTELTDRVRKLERQLSERDALAEPSEVATSQAAPARPATTSAKSPVKAPAKTPAKRSTSATAGKTAGKKTAGKKTAGKKTGPGGSTGAAGSNGQQGA